MYTLSEFLGNEELIKNFKNAVKTKNIFHAFILTGISGLGKKTFAKSMAKSILCQNFSDKNDACNTCSSCVSFDENNNPDIAYVKPKDKKTIGVDDLREQLIDTVNIKPFKYNHKIYIIENAELLTPQAQNALLKTLEEPPSFVVIILVCDNTSLLLPTVLSRCILYRLKELPADIISNNLKENLSIDTDKANFISEYSRGSLGLALKISSSEEFNNMRKEIIYFLNSLHTVNIAAAVGNAKLFEKYKTNKDFISVFYLWYKDVLTYLRFGDENFLVQKDIKKDIILFSQKETINSVIKKLDLIWDINKKLIQNVNFVFALEYMIINLKE